jgi:hypothetical protein
MSVTGGVQGGESETFCQRCRSTRDSEATSNHSSLQGFGAGRPEIDRPAEVRNNARAMSTIHFRILPYVQFLRMRLRTAAHLNSK